MGKDAAKKSTTPNAVSAAGVFGGALFDIGWRLAIVVIGGLWLGSKIDQMYGTKPWGVFSAFVIIIISFVLIIRQILQRIPKEFGGLKHD